MTDVIDLFAGGGGFSTGAKMAGMEVVWAANHSQKAVSTHQANHPGTIHVCQDLMQADWRQLPRHDGMLASPCCQGHSPARGKGHNNPKHDASRSTAWAVIDAMEYHRQQFAVIENVPEFLDWVLYPAWKMAIEALGCSIAPHMIDAADHGVAQHRERMILVITRSKNPLWLNFEKKEHVGADTLIDFDSDGWSLVDKPGRAEATLRRVANGRRDFGSRFVMPYYGSGSGLTGRDIRRPLGTLTTRARWAVVDGARMRMLNIPECRKAMSFPDDYKLPKTGKLAHHLLGNAVAPIMARDVLLELQRHI